MTPERAKELLPVITAFAEGKTIQFKTKKDGKWTDSIRDISFNNSAAFYRVKPEKVYTTLYVVYNKETGEVFEVFKRKDLAENFADLIKTNHTVKEAIIETECEQF